VPTENDGTEPALVWKEPAQTISHDTEMFLKGVKTLNAAPSLMASTTETSTTDPEAAELAAPARPAKAPETSPVPEEIFAPAAALVPAGPLAELRMKTVEANVLESVAKSRSSSNEAAIVPSLKVAETVAPMPSSPRIPEPVAKASPIAPQVPPMPASVPAQPSVRAANDSSVSAKQATADLVADAFAAIPAMPARVSEPMAPVAIEKKNLESAPASQPLADKETVVHTQPPRSSEKVLPATNGNSKAKEQMKQENNPQFDTLVLDVAHIIFGDNAPDINVRLVRMALETVWQNRAELQSVDAIAKEIARIIFGETNTSDLNVRLVRMALERSNSIALFKAA
jgi:hypothetical protein